MKSKRQQTVRGLERMNILKAMKRDELSDGNVPGAPTRLSRANSDSSNIIVGLEKTDAFQQRLSTFNSAIKRQLKIKTNLKGVSH